MVRPKRSEQHPNLQAAITQAALEQITRDGAASLSLRGVARSLNISAPAIYNYYGNRDELITALIIDAYKSFAQALAHAKAVISDDDYMRQFQSVAHAYRSWASNHTEEYFLMFGTALPGYEPPWDILGPVASGSMTVLIQILETAWDAGQLNLRHSMSDSSELLNDWKKKIEYEVPTGVIQVALSTWAHLHGLVSLELHNQLCMAPNSDDLTIFFESEVQSMLDQLGLR